MFAHLPKPLPLIVYETYLMSKYLLFNTLFANIAAKIEQKTQIQENDQQGICVFNIVFPILYNIVHSLPVRKSVYLFFELLFIFIEF